jgi:eukaryotic-like serine/threonine-protein kinase
MTFLSPERWRTVEPLLERALDVPAAGRGAFLDDACGDDTALRSLLESLLAAADRPAGLLDEPLSAVAGGLLAPEVPRPDRLGPFRVTGTLGHGGMGVVYAGERADGAFEQRVALKVVRGHAGRAEFTERFLAERSIQARLAHPNIVRLLDGGATDLGEPWFAMELVEGEPLTVHADRRGLDLRARVRLLSAVCEAVRYAHAQRVVHRDLKPSNLLVTADGQVKLLDFGIARVLDPGGTGGEAPVTRTDLRALTPEYAAPEQVRGEPVTPATDVYALGAVLYELLAGARAQRVDRSAPPSAIERAICDTEPPPLRAAARAAGRAVDDDLDTVVRTALHKDPGRRYPSAAELLEDLERWQAGLPIRARPDSAGYRLRKYARRHRLELGAALAITLALGGGTALAARQAAVAEREAAHAAAARDFLAGLFGGVTPAEALGREVTARELLDRGAASIDQALGDRPRLHADLLGQLASIYHDLGHYERADSLARRAVAVAGAVDGGRGALTAALLARRARIVDAMGRPAEAESLLIDARRIQRRAAPRDRELEAAILHALGLVAVDLGRTDEAVAALERSLALTRALRGPAHPDVAWELNALGIVLHDAGREPARAESLFRATLAIQRRTLAAGHPSLLATLTNLADVLRGRGAYDEAETLLAEELAVRRRVLGAAHPDVAYSLNALALLAEEQGRYAEAESLHVAALGLRRDALGPDHPMTVASLNNLAVVRYRRNDLAGAAEAFREAAAVFRRTLGPEHRSYNTALHNLGVVLTGLGRAAEAEPLLREALALRVATQGDSTPDVAASHRGLGVAAQRRGRLAEAENHFRAAVAIYRRVFPDASLRTAEALLGLGEVLTARGRPAEALPLLDEVVAVRDSLLVPGDYRRGEALLALGRGLARAGRGREARPPLLQAVTILADAGRAVEAAEARALLAGLR